LAAKHVDGIFSNVEDILAINEDILKALEVRLADWHAQSCLGDVFLRLVPILKQYHTYCSQYRSSITLVEQKRDSSSKFDLFLKVRSALLQLACTPRGTLAHDSLHSLSTLSLFVVVGVGVCVFVCVCLFLRVHCSLLFATRGVAANVLLSLSLSGILFLCEPYTLHRCCFASGVCTFHRLFACALLSSQNKFAELNMGLPITSLLIQPIQRIPRYKLLFEELYKHTYVDHTDRALIEDALERIKYVADYVNESVREHQSMEKVMELKKKFAGNVPPLLAPKRFFIRDGTLTKVCRKTLKKRVFFLFSDILIYGVRLENTTVVGIEYKFHRLIHLNNASVVNLPDRPSRCLCVCLCVLCVYVCRVCMYECMSLSLCMYIYVCVCVCVCVCVQSFLDFLAWCASPLLSPPDPLLCCIVDTYISTSLLSASTFCACSTLPCISVFACCRFVPRLSIAQQYEELHADLRQRCGQARLGEQPTAVYY
jgi:RhoGEF domain